MNKKKLLSLLLTALLLVTMVSLLAAPALAAEEEAPAETQSETGESKVLSTKAIAAAIVVGLVGTGGAIAMGMAISHSTESMARQPEASGKINSAMMLGLVFIETAIIYALIVAILIIFVL